MKSPLPKAASSTDRLSDARRSSLRRVWLEWYSQEHRALPWRESRDAYRIWISESMLQQTRVQTVLNYWPRFVERFATIAELAQSSEEEVLGLWSGLGYYSRARKLREAAIAVMEEHGGEFPRTREEALALPGVGPYTAGAVLSIAYDLPEPLVDGNVQRVFCRLFGLDDLVGSTTLKKRLWFLAEQMVTAGDRAGDWNQAVMELGATVCTPKSPSCEDCPLRRSCVARREERQAQLPRMPEKRPPTEVKLRIYLVEADGRLLLEQRPSKGQMANMWQFPTVELPEDEKGALHLFPGQLAIGEGLRDHEDLGSLRHSITRYRIQAQVQRASLSGELHRSWRWFDPAELSELALTGMARKVLALRD